MGIDVCFSSVPVFTLDSFLASPNYEKLTFSALKEEQGGDNLQTLIYNNSRDTRSLKSHLWSLQNQVLTPAEPLCLVFI